MIHRAQTQRCTPKALTPQDRDVMRAMYREARRRTQETGELHVVDHIVPKINPFVMGLHVPWNLQIVHWRWNARKGSLWNEQLELLWNTE